jgi:hypothetical protein
VIPRFQSSFVSNWSTCAAAWREGAIVGSYYVVESLTENVAATHVGRLRGFEFVARGVSPGAVYAFVMTEFDGRVSVVDARCVAASEVGLSLTPGGCQIEYREP